LTDQDRTTMGPSGYEPPRVERVLTPAELEREILYAGTPSGQDEVEPLPPEE
jgi:hypothetical protein